MTAYAELLAIASEAVDVARDIFLTHAPGHLTSKGDRDMASEVDYAIERKLAAFLKEKTPHIGFLGEEDGKRGIPSELTWTLDPIDGTVNFIHGSPLCGISLALLRDKTPILGVVDLPCFGMRYTATENGGAYNGERRLSVSAVTVLPESVVAVGDYAVGACADQKNTIRLGVTSRLASTVQRVRMHGSAAIDLVWLAEGRVDAVIIMSNQPWDTAAGVIIAREAGAEVVDQDGSPHTSESSATIAANPRLLPAALKLVSEAQL